MTTLVAKVIVEFVASGRLSTRWNNDKNNIRAWRFQSLQSSFFKDELRYCTIKRGQRISICSEALIEVGPLIDMADDMSIDMSDDVAVDMVKVGLVDDVAELTVWGARQHVLAAHGTRGLV
ncbi:hypothetical protein F0562_005729 [Nyssa sinensis]|uniref:Uncharacterized protein n=1 Tax=Nyssa sinensis TaxID=561372 RepID=A0A5J5AJ42_9ASTE|nr:hypothetical protein F0562_005729 [Nyssa sinensis]